MSSDTATTMDSNERDHTEVHNNAESRRQRKRREYSCHGSNGKWSGINIAAMVIGFVVFWPVGLLVLFWIATGRKLRDLPPAIAEKWSALIATFERNGRSTGNIVFNEYQQTQYDRIREIKSEIKDRSKRFQEFRNDARRRADEKEFNRFMDNSPAS